MAESSSSAPMSSPKSASQTSAGPPSSPPAETSREKPRARPPPAARVYGRRRQRSATPSDHSGADEAADAGEGGEGAYVSPVLPLPLPPDSDEIYDLQRSDGRKRGLSRHPSWPSSDPPEEPIERSTPTRSAPERGELRAPSIDEIDDHTPSPQSGDEAGPDTLPDFIGAMAGKMKGRSAAGAATARTKRISIGRPGEPRRPSPNDTSSRRLQLAESSRSSSSKVKSASTPEPTAHDAKQSRVMALVQQRKQQAAKAAALAGAAAEEAALADAASEKPREKGAPGSLAGNLMAQLEDDGDDREGWADVNNIFTDSQLNNPDRGEPDVRDDAAYPAIPGVLDSESDEGFEGPKRRRATKARAGQKLKPLSRREQIEMEKETQRLNAQNKNEAARNFVQEAQSRRREGKTFGVSELHELMQRKAKRPNPATTKPVSKIEAGGTIASSKQPDQPRSGLSLAEAMEEGLSDDDNASLDISAQIDRCKKLQDVKPTLMALLAHPNTSPENLDEDDEIEIEQPKLGRLGSQLFGKSRNSSGPRSKSEKPSLGLALEPALRSSPKPKLEVSTPVRSKVRNLKMTTPGTLSQTLWSTARQQTRRKNDHAKLVDRGLGPKAPGGFVLPTNPFSIAPGKDEESGSDYDPEDKFDNGQEQYSGESEGEDAADGDDEPGASEEPAALAAPSEDEAEDEDEDEDDTVRMPAPRPRRSAVESDSESEHTAPSKVLAKQTQSSHPGSQSPRLGDRDRVLAQASLPASQVSYLQSQSDIPPPGQTNVRFSQIGVLGTRSRALQEPSQSGGEGTDDVLGNFFAPTQATETELPTQAFTETTDASVIESSGPPLAGETRPSSVLGSAFGGSDANPPGLSQFFASTQGFSQADTSGALDAAPVASLLGNPNGALGSAFNAPTQTQPSSAGASDALGAAFDAPTQTQPAVARAPESQAEGVLGAARGKRQSKKFDGFAALRAKRPAGLDWEDDDPLPAIATFDAERYEAEADEAEKQRVWAERRAMLETPQMYMNKRGLYTQTKPEDEEDGDSDDDDALKMTLETQSPLPLVANTQSPFGVGESPFPRSHEAVGDTSVDTTASIPYRRKRFHRGGSLSLHPRAAVDSAESSEEAGFFAPPPAVTKDTEDAPKPRTAFDTLMHASKRGPEPNRDKKRLKRSAFVEGEAEESDSDEDRGPTLGNKMAGVFSDESDGEKRDDEADTDSEDDGADLEDLVNNEREADEANKDELVAAKARKDREQAEADLEKQVHRVTEGKWRNRQNARSGFDATLDQDADDARDLRLAARPGSGVGGARAKRHLEGDGLDALAHDPNAAPFLRTYEQSHATLQGDIEFLAAPEQSDEDGAASSDEEAEQAQGGAADSRDIYRQIQEDKKAQRASRRNGVVDDDEDCESRESEDEVPVPLGASATKRRRREDPWSRMLRPADESDDELEAERYLSRRKKAHVMPAGREPDDYADEYCMRIPSAPPRRGDDDEQDTALFSTMTTDSMVAGGSSAVTSLARSKPGLAATNIAAAAPSRSRPPSSRPRAPPSRSALDAIANRRGKFED